MVVLEERFHFYKYLTLPGMQLHGQQAKLQDLAFSLAPTCRRTLGTPDPPLLLPDGFATRVSPAGGSTKPTRQWDVLFSDPSIQH
jgi:hypothetical protein